MDNGKPGADRPIDVIIADDHSVVRDGIRTVLERTDGEFRVVGEAADVPSTIREVRELKPDLLTLDLSMPGGSSLGALMATGEENPSDGVALSEREQEVVRLIANGYTNPQIAEQLHVAERTVKTYRARAIEKLGFSSRAEITAYVRRVGLAD